MSVVNSSSSITCEIPDLALYLWYAIFEAVQTEFAPVISGFCIFLLIQQYTTHVIASVVVINMIKHKVGIRNLTSLINPTMEFPWLSPDVEVVSSYNVVESVELAVALKE